LRSEGGCTKGEELKAKGGGGQKGGRLLFIWKCFVSKTRSVLWGGEEKRGTGKNEPKIPPKALVKRPQGLVPGGKEHKEKGGLEGLVSLPRKLGGCVLGKKTGSKGGRGDR